MISLDGFSKVRLILGDQLNASHCWFKQKDDDVLYLMAELRQETDYVVHHVQKVLAFFAAMEGFAAALKQAGHKVVYLSLDDTADFACLPDLLDEVLAQTGAKSFDYMQPDEFRLSEQLLCYGKKRDDLSVNCVDSEHFYLPFAALSDYVKPDHHNRLEFFYRRLRKQFNVLMDEQQPLGGQWNFDSENRRKLSKQAIVDVPAPLVFSTDVSRIIARLTRHQIKTLGQADRQLLWPVSRKQSLALLDFFCLYLLPHFGRYQDAMINQSNTHDLLGSQDVSWSLYHSRLSFSLNCKMLSPQLVIERVIAEYVARPDEISIEQVEGFVRQILGWREFVRAVYWVNMPDFADKNYLGADRRLPRWFWTGKTKMNCLHHAISQSLRYGYAHHIQRLMVTGNFCLLAGIDPDEVDLWYLGIYVDAIEWVELPNTRGMSQFADGGLVGSKAYGASGNYINKMSHYCQSCHYDVKAKVGDDACPLNSLYWYFMVKHQADFQTNPRNSMVYRQWAKQPDELQQAVLNRAELCLADIEAL